MAASDHKPYDAAPRRSAPRPALLECRECEAFCERVVSPWRCLKAGCTYIYAFTGEDTVYFGCLYKVFTSELDLSAFTDNEGRPAKGPDPYGALKVARTPLARCPVWIERAYDLFGEGSGCCNRGFLHGAVRQG